MPRLKSDPITESKIRQYLAEKDDFAFELHCLRELNKRTMRIEHGGTYPDPVTGKSRQFDFRLMIRRRDGRRISVALECKNLKPNFPLLVSRVPRITSEAFHQTLIRESDRAIVARIRPIACGTRAYRGPISSYPLGEHVGKATAQIGESFSSVELYADDSEVHENGRRHSGLRTSSCPMRPQRSMMTNAIVMSGLFCRSWLSLTKHCGRSITIRLEKKFKVLVRLK